MFPREQSRSETGGARAGWTLTSDDKGGVGNHSGDVVLRLADVDPSVVGDQFSNDEGAVVIHSRPADGHPPIRAAPQHVRAWGAAHPALETRCGPHQAGHVVGEPHEEGSD